LATLVLLVALTWLAVPPLVKSQLSQRGSAALGRQVTLQAVRFNPLSLQLELQGLEIARADHASAQLSVQRVVIDARWASLMRLAPVLDALTIDQPVLHLTHMGPGQLDVQDIVQRLTATDQAVPATAPNTPPPRFAVYNIELLNGHVEVLDAPHQQRHVVDHLNLSLPFISTLKDPQAVRVQPRLSFNLNGSRFDTQTDAQPFNSSLTTEATLHIRDLDLAPYLGLLPTGLPVQPTHAVLEADLKAQFSHTPEPSLRLSGEVRARDLKLTDARHQPLLELAHASVVLTDVRPLEHVALLGDITLDQAALHLHRDAQGALNLAPTATKPQEQEKNKANTSTYKSARGQKDLENLPNHASSPPWKLGVASFKLTPSTIGWTDEQTPGPTHQPAQLRLTQVQASASQLSWPLPSNTDAPATWQAAAQLEGNAPLTKTAAMGKDKAADRTKKSRLPSDAPPATPKPAQLSAAGTLLAQQAQATVKLESLALDLLAPYLAQHLTAHVSGQLDTTAQLKWAGAPSSPDDTDAPPAEWSLTLDSLSLSALRLVPSAAASTNDPANKTSARTSTTVLPPEGFSMDRLELAQIELQPGKHQIQLGQVRLTHPVLQVHRHADGHWMLLDWQVPASVQPIRGSSASAETTAGAPATPNTPTPADTAPAWAWQLGELAIADGRLGWLDESVPRKVSVLASGLQLNVKGLTSAGGAPATGNAALTLASGRTEPGTLQWRGTLLLPGGSTGPQVRGQLTAQRLPLHALAPYATGPSRVQLRRADTSFQGSVAYSGTSQGPQLSASGDGLLEDFSANSLPDREPLLRWKALSLKGLDVQLQPGQPPRVTVGSGALSDFFARIVIQSNGRINLQDLGQPPPENDEVATAQSAPTPATGSAAPGPAPAPAPSASPAQAATSTSPAQNEAAAPVVRVGPFSLLKGQIDFSDLFIRPNYSAHLSELTGRLGGFASDSKPGPDGAPQMAELELHGKAEGTATLDITGKLNPLAKPLALDIQGRVRDLELPALSPYTIKYTGHGIERGKLSMDVTYTVQPDGQLTARNQLVLNQLTFGDPVPGATASLPVRLAAALLSDSNGVIDLDLPISGSLNDPQFRLGSVIFKIIGNLIAKAVTAPFSLLASAFTGGAEELSQVAFAPGRADINAAAQAQIAKLADALLRRPQLNLTVVGTAHLTDEHSAWQHERLEDLIRERAQRERLGNTPATPATTEPTLSAEDRLRALTTLYKRTDMPKPRNMLGLTKDLPPADMEALLLAHMAVPEQAMHDLAVQRAVAVRDALVALKVPVKRLFLGAPQTGNFRENPPTPGSWIPRVELMLNAR
jgi:hypothetical protein